MINKRLSCNETIINRTIALAMTNALHAYSKSIPRMLELCTNYELFRMTRTSKSHYFAFDNNRILFFTLLQNGEYEIPKIRNASCAKQQQQRKS